MFLPLSQFEFILFGDLLTVKMRKFLYLILKSVAYINFKVGLVNSNHLRVSFLVALILHMPRVNLKISFYSEIIQLKTCLVLLTGSLQIYLVLLIVIFITSAK